MDDVVRFAIAIFVLVFSCVIHECAHAWTAWKLGDPTSKAQGRLTLNPVRHVDLFWTIILPVLMYLTAKFPLGGPRPVPVNPLNFTNPRTGHMWTALAGPASNLLIAAAAVGILWILRAADPDLVRADRGNVSYNAIFFYTVMLVNVGLAAFNLIPVPPLDGSRFLQFLLGPGSDEVMGKIERLGVIPIFLAAWFLTGYAVRPFVIGLQMILVRLFGLEYADALLMAYFNP